MFPLKTIPIANRTCGPCRACCSAVGVHELAKPLYTSCQHECNQGCAIYETRPQSCRDYWCLWLGGFLDGDERRRPDNLGIIFDSHTTHQEDCLGAWEVWQNAAEQPQASYLLKKLATKFVILLRRFNSNKRTVYGPAYKLANLTILEKN